MRDAPGDGFGEAFWEGEGDGAMPEELLILSSSDLEV